jgi:hypothetical protein
MGKRKRNKVNKGHRWPFRICENTKLRGHIFHHCTILLLFKGQVPVLKRVGNKSAGIILNQPVLLSKPRVERGRTNYQHSLMNYLAACAKSM